MLWFTHEHDIIYSQTLLDDTAHDKTIIYRQLFAANEKEEKFQLNDNFIFLLLLRRPLSLTVSSNKMSLFGYLVQQNDRTAMLDGVATV